MGKAVSFLIRAYISIKIAEFLLPYILPYIMG